MCKLLGAIYRVPLTRLLGAEGLGAYQMAFPLYTALLTLSSTGIPTALSKLIAEGGDARRILKKSLLLFGGTGLIASVLTVIFSGGIARLAGNDRAAYVYAALAPSVFFVSVISCVRGYCQGRKNMLPTALSQMTEQAVKLAFGLFLCSLFGKTPYEKAALATLAVTISEVAALFVVVVAANKAPSGSAGQDASVKRILTIVFPITLTSVMIPLSRLFDGFFVINLLPFDTSEATALFGLYGGAAESVVSMPVALCYAIAVAAIPEIAKDKSNIQKKVKPLFHTLVISVIIALLTGLFAGIIVNVLYGGLAENAKNTLTALIGISSAQIIGLSVVQTTGAILVATGRTYLPVVSLAAGISVKVFLTLTLVPSGYGIYGCALADVFCYFIAASLNYLAIAVKEVKGRKTLVASAELN